MGEAELDGVCFRFGSDLALVSYERKLYSIADFLHHCCTVHGVAEIEIANHQLIPKVYPLDRAGLVLQSILACKCLCKAIVRCSYTFLCQEDPAAEAIPVPYRYSMTPGRNGICNVFKPNMLAHGDPVRPGLFLQQFLDCL